MRPPLSLRKARLSSLASLTAPKSTSLALIPIPRISPYQTGQPLTRRLITTTSRMSILTPRFSAGSDAPSLEAKLAPLLKQNAGRWTLAAEGEALEREFKFKTFAKTWDFMTAVSLQCKLKSHHPEWSNVFNTTFIRWTTHHPKGLSDKDVELAAICDALAKDFGEQVVDQLEQPQQQQDPGQQEHQAACALPGLADRAAGSAGPCCIPVTKP